MRNDVQEMWTQLRKFAATASRQELEAAILALDSKVLDTDIKVAKYAAKVRIFPLEELQARGIAELFKK